jgi:hypothetical protein
MNQFSPFRILSIALTTGGFGYAVVEGESSLIVYGRKKFQDDKSIRSLVFIKQMIARFRPDILVLYDVNAKGIHRQPRIKELDRQVIKLAIRQNLKTTKISGIEVRRSLLGDLNGTKHDVAERMAKEFPDELVGRLPPKRKWWNSEDGRMDIFDAVALAVVFRLKERDGQRRSH